MCGIIGINSSKPVSATILSSLKKLEYRGYDSAGIATLSNGLINEVKSEGRVDNLEKNLLIKNMEGTIGIGHVRWATHGAPNSINAHPHSSQNVSVVHNGIIENSTLLKKFLVSKGHKFKSQTDTEVIVHLITEYLKELNLKDAIIKTLKQLHGSFALGVIFKDQPDLIVGARRGSPLAVGYGPNENYLGSDSYALKSMTNKISYLDDGEFCIIKKDQIDFFNEDGLIDQVISMGDISSGLKFFYRLPPLCYHTLLIHSEALVFHEITNGPFKMEDTIWAPWSPDEADQNAVIQYMAALVNSIQKLITK